MAEAQRPLLIRMARWTATSSGRPDESVRSLIKMDLRTAGLDARTGLQCLRAGVG